MGADDRRNNSGIDGSNYMMNGYLCDSELCGVVVWGWMIDSIRIASVLIESNSDWLR